MRCILAPKKDINRELVDFLKKQPFHKLERALLSTFGFHFNDDVSIDIIPVLDGDFLPKKISELRTEAPKKLIMSGSTKYEGLFRKFKMQIMNNRCLQLVFVRIDL